MWECLRFDIFKFSWSLVGWFDIEWGIPSNFCTPNFIYTEAIGRTHTHTHQSLQNTLQLIKVNHHWFQLFNYSIDLHLGWRSNMYPIYTRICMKLIRKIRMKMHVKPHETTGAKATHTRWFSSKNGTLHNNYFTPNFRLHPELNTQKHSSQIKQTDFDYSWTQKHTTKMHNFLMTKKIYMILVCFRKCKWNAMMYAFAYFKSHCRFNSNWDCMLWRCACVCVYKCT